MPLTKAKVLSITATTTFSYAGEPVTVEFYPLRVLALTAERAAQIQRELEAAGASEGEGEGEGDDPSASYALIGTLWSTYLAGWDVTDGEGSDGIGAPIALDDGATLFELDPRLDLFAAIMTACREAAINAKPSGTPLPRATGDSSAPAVPATSSNSPVAALETAAASRSTRSPSRTSHSKRGLRPTG